MRTSRVWVAACLLAAGACNEPGEQAQQAEGGADTAAGTPATATTEGEGHSSHGTATIKLMALKNSGVEGTAVVTRKGDVTEMELSVTGGGANATHQAHIHSGSCETQGPVAAPLTPVKTDASGSGVSTTRVTLPWEALADGKHYIQAHEAGGKQPVACGNIPS